MNKHYVIQWKSTVNGRAGRGTKLFNREEAEQLVEELNNEYPQIEHEIIEAPAQAAEGIESTEAAERETASQPTTLLSFA